MRDNYVGDIGDFYKYALLRRLTGHTAEDQPQLKLGVVWYLYQDPCKETDGLHLDYLEPKLRDRFRNEDPELHDALAKLVADGKRSVKEVEKRGILPSSTKFFSEPLSFAGLPKGNGKAVQERLKHRKEWLNRALKATEGCDVIFVDPDNGLEVKSTAAHHDKGPKFCFYDELKEFWNRGQSLVIYQHRNMHETAETQIQNRIAELKAHLPRAASIEGLYYPARSGRIFFVVEKQKHYKPA